MPNDTAHKAGDSGRAFQLRLPRLYAIVDVEVCAARGWEPEELARAYLAGGARLLQLRAKHASSAAVLDLARAILSDARDVGANLIINDRPDLAVLAGASGVHVGQDDVPVAEVRQIVGPEAIVGLSTHTERQVIEALAQPISYIAIGPIFGTSTKDTGYRAVGVETIRETARLAAPTGMPVVAIGGITLERVKSVWEAGAASAAVITDLMTGDPAARVAEFLRV